jgi:hypothetical protein
MKNREKIIRYAVEHNISSPKDFANLVSGYYYNPDKILRMIG